MQCPKCNKKLSDEFKFCPICGEEIINQNSPQMKEDDPESDQEEKITKWCEKCGREIFNGTLCDECRKPPKRNWGIITLILVALVLVISVALFSNNRNIKSYENEYLSKAEALASEYNLKDAKIKLEYMGKYKGITQLYRQYDLTVESSKFEKLDNIKKYNFVKSLDGSSVGGADFIVLTKVVSDDNEYKIYSNVLNKNGKSYFSMGGISTTTPRNSSPTSFSRAKSDTDIWVWSQKIVQDNLKSPSSAKFPRFGSNDISIQNINGDIYVYSYVDADNGFGAKIRTPFIIRFIDGNMDNYEIDFDE